MVQLVSSLSAARQLKDLWGISGMAINQASVQGSIMRRISVLSLTAIGFLSIAASGAYAQSSPAAPLPASTQSAPVVTSAPGATEAQFGGDPNEVICRDKQNSTGSMFKEKVCHTRREWAEGQSTARSMMNGMHHYQGGSGWAGPGQG